MTRDLRVRIAKALGWTQAEVGQFSLPALRELVRPVDSRLAADIDDVVEHRHHWTTPRGHASGSKRPSKRVTLKDIPTSQIDMFVGRFHVGTPDEEIAKEIERLTDMPGWTPAARKLAVKYALDRHHKNRSLYSSVMGGRIGRGR